MNIGFMKKKIMPVLAAIVIVAGTQLFKNENSCCDGSVPIVLLLSPLGCNEAKQPASATSDVNSADRVSMSKSDKMNGSGKVEHRVTFVEIGSVNCIPCKMMQPIMREIEREYSGQVSVVFHDVWTPEGKPKAMEYGIRAIPTQVFLDKDGKEYYRHIGFFPKDELVKVLKMKGVN